MLHHGLSERYGSTTTERSDVISNGKVLFPKQFRSFFPISHLLRRYKKPQQSARCSQVQESLWNSFFKPPEMVQTETAW